VPSAPIWEVQDSTLPEIAMARRIRTGRSVVIYNPDTCREMGAACGFFRLHAFAHGCLNHTILASPEDFPASLESEADCWAARNGKPDEVYAAVQLFLEEGSSDKWKIHGDLQHRAKTVRDCAIAAGNWNEAQ